MITIKKYVNVPKKRISLIKEIAGIVASDLDLTSIDIIINICPSVEMGGYDGFCYSQKRIDIVNKKEVEELFKVIAHELRHAYQFKSGLIDCNGKWRGKEYKNYDGTEIDAERYERIVWRKYKNSLTYPQKWCIVYLNNNKGSKTWIMVW